MGTVGAKTFLQKIKALTGAIVVIGAPGQGRTQPYSEAVTLSIVDRDTGQELRTWRHHGRLFVAGQPGARYALRVANNTDDRVLAVMSVDGVNVLTGETAGYDQRGYVFSPHESYEVTGWRKSDTEVAAFTFAPLPQSYAARTGRPTEVGVLGIAVFKEKAQAAPVESETPGGWPAPVAPHMTPPPPMDVPAPPMPLPPVRAPAPLSPEPPRAAPPAPVARESTMARRDALSEKLGTAHGARESSLITIVNFERATAYPQYVRQIEYDSYDNLVAAGVIPSSAGPPNPPRPFPLAPVGGGYVPDPPPQP